LSASYWWLVAWPDLSSVRTVSWDSATRITLAAGWASLGIEEHFLSRDFPLSIPLSTYRTAEALSAIRIM
jgi:hypothetical protein